MKRTECIQPDTFGSHQVRDVDQKQGCSATPRISIGITTRSRPKLLSQLFESLAALSIDGGLSVDFIVVENNIRKTLEESVSKFRADVPWASVVYENESRVGIPNARNRVLDIALKAGSDLLAFVDDDETVDSSWLRILLQELRDRDLDIVGGPVRLHPCPEDATTFEKIVWKGLAHRQALNERSSKRRRDTGEDSHITIVTNNWLVNLYLIRVTGIKFDESLGFSGGSDSLFFQQIKSQGARSGWAPEAIVTEHVPKSRLTFKYQFCRARDQAIANYRKKYTQLSMRSLVLSCGLCVYKLLSAALLTGLSLADGGRSLVRGVRAFGFAVGRGAALFGMRSFQFKHVQGE